MRCIFKVILVRLLVLPALIFETTAIHVTITVPPKIKDILDKTNISDVRQHLNNTRRIINGEDAMTGRPYMVYLKLPVNNPKYKDYRRWLCGGVIIHEEYILTSAACIQDAKHFYVVSGTYRHDERDDRYNNACIKNGAKKAVWKCIPRNYVFDGHENDNIRWMNNDIAVVRVEDEFDFNRRIRGCDFIPKPVCYNNQSSKLEDPGTEASIAGWGSVQKYNEGTNEAQNLLQTEVRIISKSRCKRRWGKRYHNIIDNYMICSKDLVPDMSEICQKLFTAVMGDAFKLLEWQGLGININGDHIAHLRFTHDIVVMAKSIEALSMMLYDLEQVSQREKYVDCTDIMYTDESGEADRRRVLNPSELVLHSAYHNESGRRQLIPGGGGFCENDHGGPLVYGSGVSAVVIGIISACLVKEQTNQCYGPFLYTSVYKNRHLITCAIYKDIATGCDKLFRSTITHTETEMSWLEHADGPAKNEIKKMRRKQEEEQRLAKFNSSQTPELPTIAVDKAEQHGGVIVRLFNATNEKANKKNSPNTTVA